MKESTDALLTMELETLSLLMSLLLFSVRVNYPLTCVTILSLTHFNYAFCHAMESESFVNTMSSKNESEQLLGVESSDALIYLNKKISL